MSIFDLPEYELFDVTSAFDVAAFTPSLAPAGSAAVVAGSEVGDGGFASSLGNILGGGFELLKDYGSTLLQLDVFEKQNEVKIKQANAQAVAAQANAQAAIAANSGGGSTPSIFASFPGGVAGAGAAAVGVMVVAALLLRGR